MLETVKKSNEKLTGFRTVIANIVMAGLAWLATNYGIELSQDEQTAVVVTVVCIVNIILRAITKSPIFKKKG